MPKNSLLIVYISSEFVGNMEDPTFFCVDSLSLTRTHTIDKHIKFVLSYLSRINVNVDLLGTWNPKFERNKTSGQLMKERPATPGFRDRDLKNNSRCMALLSTIYAQVYLTITKTHRSTSLTWVCLATQLEFN